MQSNTGQTEANASESALADNRTDVLSPLALPLDIFENLSFLTGHVGVGYINLLYDKYLNGKHDAFSNEEKA